VKRNCKNEIHQVLHKHRDQAAKSDKKVGAETQEKREMVILGFFSTLFELGYKIESIYNIRQRHLVEVFNFLEDEGQSPSTIANKISIMRTFCNWIGKENMVKDSSYYVKDIASVKRTSVVQEDKSWVGNGIKVMEKLDEIREKDPSVALTLELSWAFGLRVREALMFRPNTDHDLQKGVLSVRDGTKGDRPRNVPIENNVQWDVLERAQKAADGKTDFLGKRGNSYIQMRSNFYNVLRACKITLKDNSISAHGLRHEYMHRSFQTLLGIEPPVRGGDLSQVDKKDFYPAIRKLVERAGHSREDIGAAYFGSRRIPTNSTLSGENNPQKRLF
jgi:site-specific recombinase XerC